MDLMKTLLFVIHVNAIKTHNSSAKTENVYQSCGSATLMMIVEIILMNRRTDVEIETVVLDGKSVPQETTIAVFPVGSSVTVKMIVVITLMKLILNSAPNVTMPGTSSVKMADVFVFGGDAVRI